MIDQAAAKALFSKENLKDGEQYAGLILGKDGEPDYHPVVLPGEAENVKWAAAVKWATKTGGDLPTRREQSLLFANLKDQFQPRWYWSGEQRASIPGCAWLQSFVYGSQYLYPKSFEYRARAVRRLKIL
ncbi:MAG TPA: hypothetical protein DEQ40_20215 [Oxalobacteraceae bacterium]|nr:hypothetical protein [Oxalobacteraceae bacterium]